jgi:hypothetical protein
MTKGSKDVVEGSVKERKRTWVMRKLISRAL